MGLKFVNSHYRLAMTISLVTRAPPGKDGTNPFDLTSAPAYRRWRDQKLARYPRTAEELVVPVGDPRGLTETERARLHALCGTTNMAIYRSSAAGVEDKEIPRRLGEQFGLRRLDNNPLADEDAISSLCVTPEKGARGYIPYTSRRLLWHTDGYYNPPERRIRAFVLHCVSPAARGGENELIDPEIVYIHLRDANPEYVRALQAPDAMTIPANTDPRVGVRPAQSGPVFSVDPGTGSLHMRYTARVRSIVWKDDLATRAAVRALEEILAGGSPYLYRYRLAAGEGLLCNNVLHNRSAFEDATHGDLRRLIYRARYYDRITGTGLGAAK
jgi:hypothetical protein